MVKHIVLEYQLNDLAIIKINGPELLNALDKEVAAELCAALDVANADNKIKVIIITGTGERSFCVGGDIRYVANIDPIEAERRQNELDLSIK
jgi:enoyl-CoA hydratase/carnithine racemase